MTDESPHGLHPCFTGIEFFGPVAMAIELTQIATYLWGYQVYEPDPGLFLGGKTWPRPPETLTPLPPHGTEKECHARLVGLWRITGAYAKARDDWQRAYETLQQELAAMKRSRDNAQLAFLAETERRVALEFQVADLTKTHEAQAQAKQALADEQWRNLNEAFEARKRTQRSGGAFGAP